MNSLIKQTLALTKLNLLALRQRMISTSILLLSIACVSAVLLTVLAFTNGMRETLAQSGMSSTLLVMRQGASSELLSVMFPIEVNILANNAAVQHNAKGQAIISSEMFVSSQYKPKPLIKLNNKQPKDQMKQQVKLAQKQEIKLKQQNVNLAIRGISGQSVMFHPHFKLISGKMFHPGLRELIVGAAIARKHPEIKVGSFIQLGNRKWLVTGVFSDNNSVFSSELWADLTTMQSDYNRGNSIQSLRLAMKANTNLSALKAQWQADPRLNIQAQWEQTYFANQGEKLSQLIRWVGFPVALIMAIGACIAAINTMYASVDGRIKEIATHKAIGFNNKAIFTSILLEALQIAFVGGLIGTLPLYFLFDHFTTSTQSAANLSQLIFNFNISLLMITQALGGALLIGFLGGMLPAIKALKLTVTQGLRG